jgi:hypothetical protein
VTPYAASGLDEYFAECVRAWVEANDARSPWPAATRERLQRVDPSMFDIISTIFARLSAGEQMALRWRPPDRRGFRGLRVNRHASQTSPITIGDAGVSVVW